MRSLHKYVEMAFVLFPISVGDISEEGIQDENSVRYSVTRCAFCPRKEDRKTKMFCSLCRKDVCLMHRELEKRVFCKLFKSDKEEIRIVQVNYK